MDDKKKNVPEETKELDDLEGVIEVVDFSDIRSALNKLDEKKAALDQEKKEKEAETKEKASEVKESKAENTSSDKKETEKNEPVLDVKDSKEENKISDKKESEEENKASDKKETKEEDKASDKKETKEEDKAVDKKESKEEDKASDKKETKEEDKASDKKETKEEDKASDKKESKEEDKAADKKDTKEATNKAISQSKRLADAKAAEAEKMMSATTETTSNTTNKKEKKGKKGIAIFFGVFAALIVVAYIAGFVYFSNYFYPDVAINGTNVSNMDKATAQKTLNDFYKDYVLTMETIDGKQVTIVGTDIEMNIKLQEDLSKCLKEQEAYLWFMNLMKHHDYSIGANATWNEDALESIYKDMKMLDKKLMTAPKDAYIGVEDGKFAIIKEDMGTTLIVDNFKTTVNDSLSGVVATVNLKDAGCYELPKVYQDDATLTADFASMSEFAGGVITLQLDDLTLEPGMELYDEVLQKNGDSYTVSKTKVKNYVKELAARYDTMGTERTFTSSFENGRIVKVAGSAFGYEMDQEATANALYTALQSKKATTVEAIFKTKGYTLQGENDIGDTYIEVNLSLQKVVAYKDGKKIVEGDCVSGKEATGDGTCLGLYKIQDKLSPTVLRGKQKQVTKTVTKKNKKGKKVKVKETKMEYEYESPVTFWLQFNGGYGLHDAAGWRSVYGGSIYYYSGSHGCVNLPYDVAKKLYENFELEDPVVVYFWDNENRK